jgi:hypothetical protein
MINTFMERLPGKWAVSQDTHFGAQATWYRLTMTI